MRYSERAGGDSHYPDGAQSTDQEACRVRPGDNRFFGYRKGRESGWPKFIEGQSGYPSDWASLAEKVAPYYDDANFATFVKCPVRIVAGSADRVCPWKAVVSAYNAIPSTDKELHIGDGMTHNVFYEFYRHFGKWLQN